MFLDLLFLALGVAVGSFFAALSWRYPRGISSVSGRSFCPNCSRQIAFYDNIPLLSYLFLSGKCRNCSKHISLRYPVIEAGTGFAFLCLYRLFSLDLTLLIYSLFIFSILMLILIIDFEHKVIPDELTFLGIGVTLLFLIFTDSRLLLPNVFAGFLPAFLLLQIHLFTRGQGMGLGDVKFAVFGGTLMGMNLSMVWLFLAFLTGAVSGIILVLLRRAGIKDRIAFGPFLVFSIGLTYIVGDKLLMFLHLQ